MKDLKQTINKIMALLASSQNPCTFSFIKKNLGITKEDFFECVEICNTEESHPFVIQTLPDDTYTLKAKLDYNDFLTMSNEKESNESLSRAAEEVLSLLLYNGISTKEDIDWMRGVNSAVSLRNLTEKELVIEELKNDISYYYIAPVVYDSLGLSKKEDLESYESVITNIKNVLALKQ